MKKVFMLAMVAFLTLAVSQKAQAIEDPNPKGTIVLGAQAGLFPGFGAAVFGDYVLVDSWWKGHFTVGGELLFRHYGSSGYAYNEFAVCGRATYGLNITKNFEVHAGTLIGVGLSTWGGRTDIESSILPCWGGLSGVRYFFNKNFGVTAEVQWTGYGNYFNAGVVYKL